MKSTPSHQRIWVNVVVEVEVPARSVRLVRAAARAAIDLYGPEDVLEVGIAIVRAETIRRLNRDFRDNDSVTDVLSFAEADGPPMPGRRHKRYYLGDIALCLEQARQQAEECGHSEDRELAYLTVHGALHLLGFDHESLHKRLEMRRAEEQVMAQLGLPRIVAPSFKDAHSLERIL